MINEISNARTGAIQAVAQGFRTGFRHWRWMTLAALFALALGAIAALPMIRQLRSSLGFNPAGASTDLGDRIQAWVESLRSLAGNTENMGQFSTAVVCCALLACLLKIWLTGGLVGSIRGGRGLGYRELIRTANTGFWPQLKQSLMFIPIYIVLALPAFFTFKWVQGIRKTAIAADQVEHANLVFYCVALVSLLLIALWFELSRAALANMQAERPRVRSSLKQGLKTLLKRPFASLAGFILFFLLGLGALALLSSPVTGIHNAWLSALCVAVAAMAGSLFRVMRLETLARVAR